jgi:hypothetical protein
MAIGNYYPISPTVVDQDLFLGTRAGGNNTVNYTAQTVSNYLNTNSKIAIGGQVSFKFDIAPNIPKTISLPGGGGDGTLFSSITQLVVSSIDVASTDTTIFLGYLVGSEILLSQQNQPNLFGHYKITNYTRIGTSNFYNLNLQYIGGNGTITRDTYYNLSNFVLSSGENIPTKTSDLINDGEDGINPFISSLALIDYAQESWVTSNFYPLTGNPSNFITSAALTPYLLSTVAASTYFPIPTGTTSQYVRGDGSLATFPTASTPTLDQVLTAGNTSLLDAKIGVLYGYDNPSSDYGTMEFYDTGVIIKGATTGHLLFYNDDTGSVRFSNGTYTPMLNFAGVGNNVYTFQNANGTLAFLSDIPSLTGYVPTSRTLSINGTTYDLTASRSWSVGTVTSVGLSMPSAFTVSSSPVTGSGTIAVTGSGTISQYVRGDGTLATFPTIPTVTPSALTKVDDTNVTLTLGGNPNTALLAATSLTLGWVGTLADSRIASASTWNAKQDAITLTTTGTGAATFISNTLNIPTPSLTGYVPYTGATSDLNLGVNNIFVNNIFDGFSSVVASASLITLTVASVPSYLVTGSGGQTFKMPNATTLPNGAVYYFNNNQSSGAILVNNNSNTLIKSVPSGGNMVLELLDNSTTAGSWDTHFQAPSNVSWSTNTFDYVGSITGATWNGVSIADNRIASSANWNTAYTNRITSLTTTGTGAATLVSNVLNIPTPPIATFTSLTTTGTSGPATLISGVLNVPQYSGGGGGSTPVKLTSQTLTVGSWTLSGGYYTYSFSNANVTTTCDVSVTPQNSSYLTAYNAQVLPFVGVAAGVATFYAQFPPQANMTVDIVITQTT